MRTLGVALLALAGPAAAQVSSEGHIYETACNPSGYVMTSKYPVGRFFGTGASTRTTEDRETIYLGASCDAARTGWTGGTWCQANGGFRVDFAEYGIGFPRQAPFCPLGEAEPVVEGCGC